MPPLKAKATITTQWNGVRKPRDIYRVLEFDIDSAIDSDADEWAVTLGNYGSDLIDVMRRDNEVLVSLSVTGKKTFTPLVRGFADEIGLDLDNRLVLQGRDMSAVAVDSQPKPFQWRNARPKEIITKEARELTVASRLHIDEMDTIPRLFRDGSESYWEFWYRIVRMSKKWMWFDADGALYVTDLNYGASPTYFFGEPQQAGQKQWIPVEQASWRKSTTSRIGEMFVYGHNGQQTFFGHSIDHKIDHWIKRPRKIVTDSSIHNQVQADIEARDEVHDSIVGAVEWRLVIADPGFMIMKNTIARVNLPTVGLYGEFFVVGARTVGGENEGLYQEVRLREKNYALPKAVPVDSHIDDEKGPPSQQLPDEAGRTKVAENLDVKYIQCFIDAANKHAGPWGFTLYLAVLLAIGSQESSGDALSGDFRNVREGGSIEHPVPPDRNIPSMMTDPAEYRKFIHNFANTAGNSNNPFKREAGVGPMQLTDRNLKVAADRLYDPQLIDEYIGGRWNPCSNIMEAAAYLRSLLRNWENNPIVNNIWNGVGAYNGGPGWKSKPAAVAYMEKIRHAVLDPDGWLDRVKAAFAKPGETPASPPVGNSASLARGILGYAARGQYRDDNGQQLSQLRKVANGQLLHSQCGEDVQLSEQVLAGILGLLNSNLYVGTFALCEDHSCYVSGTVRKSRHPQGFAVDISSLGKAGLGWYRLNTISSPGTALAKEAMKALSGYGVNQVICNGVGRYDTSVQALQLDNGKPRGGVWVSDHINHIHAGW